MDDSLFQNWVDNFQGDEFLWFADDLLPPLPRSDFVSYSREIALQGFRSKQSGKYDRDDHQNVHKRMMEFLKTTVAGPVVAERERNHKHMINERRRREKQKQNYMELHKLLPRGTKNDKKSIVQGAAETIEKLKGDVEELNRRRLELEMADYKRITEEKKEEEEEATIKLRVAHPSSGIDSLLEVLKSLKSTGTKTKSLQSNFSSHEFSAVLQVEAKMGAAKVEKEVQMALHEVEKKLRSAP